MTTAWISRRRKAPDLAARPRPPQRQARPCRRLSPRHIIHALRRKPVALLNLLYRDQLFPRRAYARVFELLLTRQTEKDACRVMAELLAHEQACEAELASLLEQDLDAGALPNLDASRERFAPAIGDLPSIQ
jgi:hypothetical protein